MKLDLKEIQKKRTNLNAQEIGDDGRARQAAGSAYERNPVFDEDEVRRMVKDGVERLTEMQCSDGGWGWFSGWGEHSWPHTTALVVHGLQIAQQNDVALRARHARTRRRVAEELPGRAGPAAQERRDEAEDRARWKEHADDLDAFVYMVLVDAGVKNAEMLDFLYRDRTHLSVYAKAHVRPGAGQAGRARTSCAMILQNIEPVRRAGRREPDRLPQAARRATTGGTGTAARTRPRPTT